MTKLVKSLEISIIITLFMLVGKLVFLTAKLNYLWQDIGGFFLVWLGINLAAGLLIFLALKKTKKRQSGLFKVITFNVLLLIIFLNTLFFAGEMYFRFFFDQSGSLGNLKTSKRWLLRHVRYNADFFRDRDFTTVKPEAATRIAVVGDSFAFGWGVDAEERFSNLLEKKLNRPQGKPRLPAPSAQADGGQALYEVYNIAKPGWESKNELEYLQKLGGMFNFDTVILTYFLNDIYNDRALNLDFVNPEITNLTTREWLKPLLERSFFLEFMAAQSKNYFNKSIEDVTRRELILYRDPKSWENHRQTLQKIVDLCRKRRQKLMVVIFPYLDLASQKPYPAAFIHQRLGEFFAKNSVDAIDLYPLLKDYPPKTLRASPYDYHPSPFVHQIVAGLLYEKLAK